MEEQENLDRSRGNAVMAGFDVKPAEATHAAPETGALNTLLLFLGTKLALKSPAVFFFLPNHKY